MPATRDRDCVHVEATRRDAVLRVRVPTAVKVLWLAEANRRGITESELLYQAIVAMIRLGEDK